MSLADSIFIFGLALIIFGPKKLPEIGRQIGKIMLEFRRASNEFKMQIEEELRSVEQADRQKQLTAAETKNETKNAVQPIEESATSSSEALTVRPPSTGDTESTESPYKPVSVPEEILESTSEESTSEESTSELTASEPAAGGLTDMRVAEVAPDAPGLAPYAAGEDQASEPRAGESQIGENEVGEHQIGEHEIGEHEEFREQTITHHG